MGQSQHQSDLIAWLESNDATCPMCEYSLRGLQVSTCPECGASLYLTVGTRDIRLGAWIVALVSFALGLGFDGVAVLLITVAIITGPGPTPTMAFIVFGGLLFLATLCGAGVSVLVSRNKRWLRMPRRKQWTVALTIFFAVAIVHAVFGLAVSPF